MNTERLRADGGTSDDAPNGAPGGVTLTGWHVPVVLRGAAVVLLGPLVLYGFVVTLSFSAATWFAGIPALLIGGPALFRVLRAKHIRWGRPGTVVVFAALIEMWSAIFLLRESNPWDNDVGLMLLPVGILTLGLGAAIRYTSSWRSAETTHHVVESA